MIDLERARREMVAIGARLYARGLVVASDGNLSMRLGDGRLLVTPSGLCKGLLQPEQLLLVDEDGQAIGARAAGRDGLRPSSELAMHLEAYRQRPDIGAVVHAHPPHVVAMSMLPDGLEPTLLPESMLWIGLPPRIPYARPSSTEGAAAIRKAVQAHDALVLVRHGSLSLGASLEQACQRTETLEQLGTICWLLRAAGASDLGPLRLEPERAAELLALRRELGLARDGDEADLRRAYGEAWPEG